MKHKIRTNKHNKKPEEGRTTTLTSVLPTVIAIRPYYTLPQNDQNMKMHKFIKHQKWQKHQNDKMQNVNFYHFKTSKIVKNRGGPISALKPGPVVPPGTQKVPDQAARISQSVSFGHLSDILAILRGGHFLTLFWSLFHDFNFITFCTFSFSYFCHFFTFSVFLILSLFHFLDFWSFFVIFHVWHQFWSLFVLKLGASMMTHFSSGKPALPLSPLLVVKLWPILVM